MITNPIYINENKQEYIDISVHISGHYKYDGTFYCNYFDLSTGKLIEKTCNIYYRKDTYEKFKVLVPGFVTFYPGLSSTDYKLTDIPNNSYYVYPDFHLYSQNTKYNVYNFYKLPSHTPTDLNFNILLFVLSE